MNRGTVMELGSKKTVVLTPSGQFLHIKRQLHHQVGEEITFSAESNIRLSRHWLASGLSAAALLLLFIGLWTFRTPPVVAYVTMDINPSVELGLDSKERVRELRAVNDDAKVLIEGIEYRGRDLDAVMSEIADKLVAANILSLTDGEVVIASVPVKSIEVEWENDVTAKMKEALLQAAEQKNIETVKNIHITTVSLPAEVREEAKQNGVSSGKMAFWLMAQSQGHDVSLETVQKQSLKKIAASWGGVDSVMHDDDNRKQKKDEWKKLLKEVKDKRKSDLKAEKDSGKDDDAKASKEPGETNSPAPSDKPEATEEPGHSNKPGRSGDDDDRGRDDNDRRNGSKSGKDSRDDDFDDDDNDKKYDDDDKRHGKGKDEDLRKSDDRDDQSKEQSGSKQKYKKSDNEN